MTVSWIEREGRSMRVRSRWTRRAMLAVAVSGCGPKGPSPHATPTGLPSPHAPFRNVFCAALEGRWMGTGLRWLGRLTLVALLLAAAACTPKPEPSGTPAPDVSLHAPSPAMSSPDPRAEVQKAVAAYTNLLNAFTTASNAGTDDTTELSKYATGSALQVLAKGLADNKAKGLHSQGTPGIDPPRVTEIAPANDPTTVKVTGCVDDTHWQLYNSKGQLADTSPSGRRSTSAQIDKSAGTWKVTALAIQGVGTCPG